MHCPCKCQKITTIKQAHNDQMLNKSPADGRGGNPASLTGNLLRSGRLLI